MGAEHLLAAERTGDKTVVEIKSFIGKSFTSELYQAIGQFIIYRGILAQKEPDRILYLAIPNDVYENQFSSELAKIAIATSQLKYIVYEITQEVVVKWQN